MNLTAFASHLGLSPSTVSRVLSGRGGEFRISAATQRRILEAASNLGVRPNELARSLRLQSSHTIGLVIPDISNPFFAALARAVEHQARMKGYTVLLADSQESLEEEERSVTMLVDRRIDGLLLAPVGGSAERLRQVIPKGLPLVQVDRVIDQIKTASVMADNFAGARDAVRFLVKHGHRRIACLQGKADSSVIAERVRGYRAGLAEAGIRFHKSWLAGGEHSLQIARTEGLRLLTASPTPTAVLALSNLLALGMIEAARSHGAAIPDALSLITFDEQPWAALLSPPLMTIAQPVEDMGRAAANELLTQMEGGSKSHRTRRIVLPVKLHVRESVAKPAQH
jgi:LacI family transcriptional regulator